MQILALSQRAPGVSAADLGRHQAAEARAACALIAQGVIRSAHLCPDRPGSVLVLECESVEAAQAHLASLPMVREGLVRFDAWQMLPYTGWQALFAAEAPQ
jgi:hypothetical protein